VTTEIPKLNLSHGQVLWALSHGMPASQETVAQVRSPAAVGGAVWERRSGRRLRQPDQLPVRAFD
jgi:hypothetical protein